MPTTSTRQVSGGGARRQVGRRRDRELGQGQPHRHRADHGASDRRDCSVAGKPLQGGGRGSSGRLRTCQSRHEPAAELAAGRVVRVVVRNAVSQRPTTRPDRSIRGLLRQKSTRFGAQMCATDQGWGFRISPLGRPRVRPRARAFGRVRHLIEQPMLGRCGPGTVSPAMVRRIASASSSPVTGSPLPGVESSNAPR